MIGDELLAEIGAAVPRDHARQSKANDMVGYWYAVAGGTEPHDVLDLGCGDGSSIDLFRHHSDQVHWTGVDIARSPEVDRRIREDGEFVTFDGVSLPFADDRFRLILARQVLEHVEQLDPLLAEVDRVLSPEGWFVGSTSVLEPFHSRSTQNLTPYGLQKLLARHGLSLVQARPGIDGLTLTLRQLFGRRQYFDRWWHSESPLNRALELYAKRKRLSNQRLNAAKLTFAGHYSFLAHR